VVNLVQEEKPANEGVSAGEEEVPVVEDGNSEEPPNENPAAEEITPSEES